MLQKWKTILTNWIQCYFNESDSNAQCVTLESLINIISHLRENFSLDESKSSMLEAYTVEEFIREKYPEFKFNNGTVEADTQEELYMVASLLLLFVCVNSKDIDIKNAMCSKLSIQDQEVILKFSKCLMECSAIKYQDVLAAINDACGHESAVTEPNNEPSLVSETPPALRSLHGEVRRLQAALDAERFDRNYLQEELSRTNLKLEKLLKDKEQQKLDIVNLKAKISMCCGQETENKISDMVAEGTAKLMKQLEQLEEKLVETQGQLDDAQYERDTYRAKVNELKLERDKLVTLNEEESSKNIKLSDELESERRIVISLRELVVELRQHQHLNRMDSSQLECDDPDASLQSLQHNSSICSEACANVVEVQLGEERAKIVHLKQQIQTLQEQLSELIQKSEIEKLSLTKIISEKDNDIFSLKHRINEEIEIKNNMTVHYSDELSKLNNDINELEQKLKDSNVQTTLVIETKMQDIQTLQEEKLSLLQSFHDETTKLENIVKNLRTDIENERTSKAKMKDDYENQLMKINEKVLNRNNELVELQNNVLTLSEQIEGLHLELRKEKQARETVIQQYNNELELVNATRLDTETRLQQKHEEMKSLKDLLDNNTNHIDQLNAEMNYLKGSVSQLTQTCNILEQNKTSLVNEISIRDSKIEEQHKEFDNWKNKVSEDRDSYKKHRDDYEMKITILAKTIDETREDMSKQKESYTAVLDSRARDIQTLQQENQSLHNELNDVKLELDQKVHSLKEKLIDNENLTEKLKATYESQIENLNLMVTKLTNFLKDKATEMESCKKEKERLQEVIESNNEVIHFLEEEVKSQKHNQEKLISEFESERLVLKNMITVTESVMEDQKVSMTQVLTEHDKDNKSLKSEIAIMKNSLDVEKNKLQEKGAALEQVNQLLTEVKKQKEIVELKYEKDIKSFTDKIDILNEEVKSKVAEIKSLKTQHKELTDVLQKCRNDLHLIEELKQELIIDIEVAKEQNKTLVSEITNLEQQNRDMNNIVQKSTIDITTLEEDNKKYMKSIELLNNEKDFKDANIKSLEIRNKELEVMMEICRNDITALEEHNKILIGNIEVMKNEIDLKVSKIESLESKTKELEEIVETSRTDLAMMEENNNELKIIKDSQETELTKKVDHVTQELEKKDKIIMNLEEKLNQINKLNIESEEKHFSLRQELSLLTEKYDKLKLERNDFKAKTDLLVINKNTITEELNLQIDALKAEINQLLQMVENCNLALKESQDKLILEVQNKENLQLEKEGLIAEVDELNSKLVQNTIAIHEKIVELETNNTTLLEAVERSKHDTKCLQEKMEVEKENYEKIMRDISAEKLVLEQKIIVCKSVIEEQKNNQKKLMIEQTKVTETLKDENKTLKEAVNIERRNDENKIKEKAVIIETLSEELAELKLEKENLRKHFELEQHTLIVETESLKKDIEQKLAQIDALESQKKNLEDNLEKFGAETNDKLKLLMDAKEKTTKELEHNVETLRKDLLETKNVNTKLVEDRNELKTKAKKLEEETDKNITELNEKILNLKDDNNRLESVGEENKKVILMLEGELQKHKVNHQQIICEFESEKREHQTTITHLKAVVEEYKINIRELKTELINVRDSLNEKSNALKKEIDIERNIAVTKIHEKETALELKISKLYEIINDKENKQKVLEIEKDVLVKESENLRQEIALKINKIEVLERHNKELENVLLKCKDDITILQENNSELKIKLDLQETEFGNKFETMQKEFHDKIENNKKLEQTLEEKHKLSIKIEEKVTTLNNQVEVLTKAYNRLEQEKNDYKIKVEELKFKLGSEEVKVKEEISHLREENDQLTSYVKENKQVILNLQENIKQGKEETNYEKLNLDNKCSMLQEYQIKAEKQLEERQKEIKTLEEKIKTLTIKMDEYEDNIKNKDNCIQDKDEVIIAMKKEISAEKAAKEHLKIDLEVKEAVVFELKQKLDCFNSEDVVKALRNEEWVIAVGQRETLAAAGSERTSHKYSGPHEKDYRDFHHQVDNTTSDLTHSSMESIKTISDLEKIIHDKNRTITTLQSDITYLKSLIADSENKLLDVSNELELSKENCHQLSSQLKKIVHQKNEEIAELKKQVTKMSATENRASQIIKVSAKYQAIILKRIAEIKTNTVLKELTNFGNSANGDNEFRRSLNAGSITMEDLENFLETTDKHLRRCTEKQTILQKERDRLSEVNRINESEIINLKKFLTELSVSFKTFSSIKELYTQKFSRVVSVQRTVRREILSLDGRINDATMCKLERGYAAVMQDLSETVMNLERWVERSISRTISTEKIKQAFMSDEERSSFASTTFQNTSLEVQIGELENSFQRLLEEVVRAPKGEGAIDVQAVTVMEVRAEYEDKLNRMKAKMKQLYQEQISVYNEKQKEDITTLQRELLKTREKLAESSKAYEEHIRALTTELWRVGEKFLTKKDELEWLRKKQLSGSLMSLQHVHSSGLVAPQVDTSRISEAHSLRSLPVQNNNSKKREGRGLHMSDEEGEVFDNRWLQQLNATPRRSSPQRSPGPRLSELRWRNSLCPPHLKSSYPAETQFAPAVDEEDIKCLGAASLGGRNQRKEVGITAYKKPGPPTPSKQAGRLSATDSELRESLRFDPEPLVSRKTSTPSRLRALFRSNKNDTAEGTPRSKRLSIFRKK